MTPNKLFENYFDEFVELFPSCNDYLNLDKYNHLKHKMENTLNKTHIETQKKLYRKYIRLSNQLLKDKSIKNPKHRLYLEILKYLCSNNLKSFNYNFNMIPISHQDNEVTSIFEMASGKTYYSFKTKKDYIDFLTKMSSFPDIIDSIIENMREGITKKYVLSKILAIKLYDQLNDAIKNKIFLQKNIKIKLDFDFNAQLECIFIYKTKELIQFLKKEYIPKCINSTNKIGLCHLPNGIEEYKFLVKASLSKNISIETIHQYGLSEVARIQNEKNKIKELMGFKGSLKEFDVYLKKRKDLKFSSKDELLETYKKEVQKINRTIMKKYFTEPIKNKCSIEAVPKYNEPFSSEAYYMPGDIEGKRAGKFYINLRDYRDNSRIDVEALTLHEANPGHHYQITHNNEQPHFPLFLKCYNNETYCEGWALYCENLGDYKTHESYYGKLNMEMVRALRLVVDTGIHYYGWGFNKTFKLMRNYLFESDIQIKNQILRYTAIPSQALSYKIGEKIILQLKEKFKGNIKQFHKKILENGQIPMSFLEKQFN